MIGGDGVDSDGDNNNNADKENYGNENDAYWGSNDEGGYNADSDA